MDTTIDTSKLPNKWIKDYRGQKFHRLTVIAFDRIRPNGGAVWRCVCDCGKITTAQISDLRSGHTTSCGCASAERLRSMRTTHGMSDTPEHNVWIGIKTRCYNPRSHIFKHYGGRGIVMCDRWRDSFENFYSDMGPRPSDKHSIERVDDDGPYSPENCRWATDIEQANNTHWNHCVTYQSKTQSVAEWARELGIPYNRLRARLLRGVPVERALASNELQRQSPDFYDKIGQERHPRRR